MHQTSSGAPHLLIGASRAMETLRAEIALAARTQANTWLLPVALLMLLGGAAAVGWPLLSSGGGRSDVKRR